MDISRELAIKILKYLDEHKNFYFPFLVVNKEYSEKYNDFVEIESSEWETIIKNENYKTFQLWENLQNLHEETLKLMSKGFLEKITNESFKKHIAELARNYRKELRQILPESAKTKEYGFNEFMNGKAEAYEDCLDLIKEYNE